ncbi:hypothetical protein OH783_06185 [Kocuria rhizophila]|uniref:hypothetical protein n=1 Tax=Kocuria rhizophila TaxID=72000 RepID=UPI00386536C0|nr:hypothetical protein OH783_06185 [Kocuria rhizophila]WSZ52687.1 hypothetical protein OG926_06205 [Kocuria rhizophila]
MTQPIPDPNPLDDPEVQDQILGKDEFAQTSGDEDDAWEEDDAQWGQDADPLKNPEEADVRQLADDETLMAGTDSDPELNDPEVTALTEDPQADREVNRGLEEVDVDPADPED